MRFENTEIFNFKNAFRGMRNPLESWNKSDSLFSLSCDECTYDIEKCNICHQINEIENVILGENDLALAKRLIKAGGEHRKFLRQIFVSVDITAPLYIWKEFDTYKVGVTANSTSTMHKVASRPITMDCFELDDFSSDLRVDGYYDDCTYSLGETIYPELIHTLEALRLTYLETKDKRYWKELIRLLPSAWLQTRTITMNYENLYNMYKQRKSHKLTEWSTSFIKWCESLPYFKELFLD